MVSLITIHVKENQVILLISKNSGENIFLAFIVHTLFQYDWTWLYPTNFMNSKYLFQADNRLYCIFVEQQNLYELNV